MIISSIIHRLFSNLNSKKNIAWTPCDNSVFEAFIKKSCDPCELIPFDNTYFGFNDIDLIICNNRVTHIDKCIDLSYFLHCPILVIDHDQRPSIINKDLDFTYGFEPIYQIAISENIFNSWGKFHDKIINYDLNNIKSIEIWKNLVNELIKINFKIKTIKYNNVEEKTKNTLKDSISFNT